MVKKTSKYITVEKGDNFNNLGMLKSSVKSFRINS